MSAVPRCTVCDARLDPYGRDGPRCDRCSEPCPTCGGNVANCLHPLADALTRKVEAELRFTIERERDAA